MSTASGALAMLGANVEGKIFAFIMELTRVFDFTIDFAFDYNTL